MTDTSNNINFLRIDEDSLVNSKTSKQKYPIKVSIPIEIIPIKSDDSLNLRLGLNSKTRKASKKNTTTHYLSSTIRPRSQSSAPSIDYDDVETYHNHRRHHHYHLHSHYQPEQQQQKQQSRFTDASDMRFFIIRHGERVDRFFGPNWFMFAFDRFGQYRPYHFNLPPDLPSRPNMQFWGLDTPLTRDGLNAALNVGRVLGINRFEPTHVYSSPAMRCILTTYQILKGLGLENKIQIRIEPGLLELGAARYGMNIFLKDIDWYNYGINVDLSYRPIMTIVPPIEREDAYYLRSKYVIREIEQRHNDGQAPLHNILIVAHATSPETLTWDLVGRQPNVYDLYTLSLNIGYLQMVITERKRQNKLWSLTQMPLQSTTLKWV